LVAHTLEELIVQTGLVSPTQLAVAQRDAAYRHRRLAPTLIDLGLIDEKRFAEWMAQTTRIPILHSIPSEVVHALERRLPRAIAREYEVVPVALSGDELTVATINPLDEGFIEVLRTTTGMRIRPVIAIYSDLMQQVTRFYPEDDAEATMLPAPQGMYPSATVEATDADDSPGSTRIITPRTGDETLAFPRMPPNAGTQLDRIEQQLQSLTSLVEALKKRLDAIEAAMTRVLPR